jgi:replication-associated recombination protein RarA
MRSFVGRNAERDLFRSALEHDECGFSVLYIHGPGGAGKTTLLRVLADDARAAGRSVVEVDLRVTSATPPAFEAACGSALTTDGVVLVIDTFEQSQALESWLRIRFLPPCGSSHCRI